MQKSDLKNLNFFYKSDGSVDEVAMDLNCFECSVYNILNCNKKLKREQIVPLFIKDINPTLWCNNTNGVFKISNQNSSLVPLWNKYIGVSEYIKSRDSGSIHYLKKYLIRAKRLLSRRFFRN